MPACLVEPSRMPRLPKVRFNFLRSKNVEPPALEEEAAPTRSSNADELRSASPAAAPSRFLSSPSARCSWEPPREDEVSSPPQADALSDSAVEVPNESRDFQRMWTPAVPNAFAHVEVEAQGQTLPGPMLSPCRPKRMPRPVKWEVRPSVRPPPRSLDELFGLLPVEVAHAQDARECQICMSDIDPEASLYRLRCGHSSFHRECISIWLMTKGAERAGCPLCRTPVFTEGEL
eukprot:TRINITY_DN105966_c0_g1_i1.p1 TRINITY_DN105966_c0_g1~~TRINITY_DN105966_c0_g1_i1.p1  ORF type:complete len:232 (+),score=28.45 TRINITY_DN105966_c0_g1_i1:80-775(+)